MLESQQSFDLQESEEELNDLLANVDHLEQSHKIWPKMLSDLICVVESQLDRLDKRADNHKTANAIITAIAHYFGGRNLYIPKNEMLQRALRDHRIFQRFDGTNRNALAEEYGLTTVQLYNILAQQKRLQRQRYQPELFG